MYYVKKMPKKDITSACIRGVSWFTVMGISKTNIYLLGKEEDLGFRYVLRKASKK